MTEGTGVAHQQQDGVAGLDDVDIAVLAAFARGLNQQQVVGEFHISRRTLVRRMADVRVALQVETNIEAVVTAVRRGLI